MYDFPKQSFKFFGYGPVMVRISFEVLLALNTRAVERESAVYETGTSDRASIRQVTGVVSHWK
jgi:hypothetical protein